LSELLASESAPENSKSRSRRGDPELVRRGRHRGPCLAGLEPMLGGDRNHRVAEKVERGTLTPTVGEAPRTNFAGTERRTQLAREKRCAC
jgi:hypothetical protein